PGGVGAHFYALQNVEAGVGTGGQVDDGQGVALAVADVGVFTIGGGVSGKLSLAKIPGREDGGGRQSQNEDDFLQISRPRRAGPSPGQEPGSARRPGRSHAPGPS